MGRALSFNRQETIDKAMRLFWQRGYEATSMRDLAEELSLPLASLYHSFGDKQGLYRQTLEAYFLFYVEPRFKSLLHSNDSYEAIKQFFLATAENCYTDAMPPGCYLVQSLMELPQSASELLPIAREFMQQIESFFGQLITQARTDNQISSKESDSVLAHYLVGLLLSIKTQAKMGFSRESITTYTLLSLQALDMST
ncbi:MAG: TetR/AcrR family transcriptional regulator [Blastocatellia bacterium]|nr:TetR/AcrR family transcriptional regulator [Blastocatellia bacterium]